jgi:competence protein ComEC
MAANSDGKLHVYMLNVGQGDTTVIVSPLGKVVVIDATRPSKLLRLLADIGIDGTIEHLIITHPHDDHFSGGNSLAQNFTVKEATVAPFWHAFGMGPPSYRALIGRLDRQDTNFSFLSGYSRWYPDGTMTRPQGDEDPEIDPDAPYLEMMGPTNGLVRMLEDAKVFNTNHLTIMTRLTWKNFRMISAGDAQMENWVFFDHERLLEEKCQVLRTAHHGSSNGTQWERIYRLGSSMAVISSDPGAKHHIPDLGSAAVFTKYDIAQGNMAVITRDAGSIQLTVESNGQRTAVRYGDGSAENIDLSNPILLDEQSNPTDWLGLLGVRMGEI